MNYFTLKDDNNTFCIDFASLFGIEELNRLSNFSIKSKKNFKNIAKDIIDTYNQILLKDSKLDEERELILLSILALQSKLLRRKCTSNSQFMEELETIITNADESLLNIVEDYVERHYTLTMDKDFEELSEKKKMSANQQLQLNDFFNKKLLTMSYISRILIPLISQFYFVNKEIVNENNGDRTSLLNEDEDEMSNSEININVFSTIMKLVFKDKYDNINRKIIKFIYSRVNLYNFSGQAFWKMIANQGVTPESVSNDIQEKIITNTLTKLVCFSENASANPVSYIQASINQTIEFLFRDKITHRNIPIERTRTTEDSNDSNKMTEYEILEMSQHRKNEGDQIIQSLSIKSVVSDIHTLLDVPVTEAEIKNAEKTVDKNTVQVRLLNMILCKYFKEKNIMDKLNMYDSAKVIVCCEKYLRKHHLVLLANILTAKCEHVKERVKITGHKITQQIETSTKYETLFKVKYKQYSSEAAKPISSLIATIFNSTFTDREGNVIYGKLQIGADEKVQASNKIGVANFADELLELAWLV